MSTLSPNDVIHPAEPHAGRRRHLLDERRFRIEQLALLDGRDDAGHPHSSVDKALRMAAAASLREIDAALERMDEGRYGSCVSCTQPLPDHRLDVLPMTPLCTACHYNEQNCRIAAARRDVRRRRRTGTAPAR